MKKRVVCSSCGGMPEFDETGRPYTCYRCCDTGWEYEDETTQAVAENATNDQAPQQAGLQTATQAQGERVMHTDKYGRTWHYKPGHDADQMIQVPAHLMHELYKMSMLLRNGGHPHEGAHHEGWPVPVVDCYFLRGDPSSKWSAWYAGIRLSDEGSDYISPGFQPELIELAIASIRTRTSWENLDAIIKLTGIGERE